MLHACRANKHGKPLTNEDKRRVVTRMLADAEWGQWSDNTIAKHCGVAHSFVAKVRTSLAAQGPELLRRIRRRPTCPHEPAATRGPPDPLFHRRGLTRPSAAIQGRWRAIAQRAEAAHQQRMAPHVEAFQS
jgi:hypothetical protein